MLSGMGDLALLITRLLFWPAAAPLTAWWWCSRTTSTACAAPHQPPPVLPSASPATAATCSAHVLPHALPAPPRVLQALIHGLNRHYYSIAINYRKTPLEERMLGNLQVGLASVGWGAWLFLPVDFWQW